MTTQVPAGTSEQTLEIRKSRFIAHAARAASRDEALAVVAAARTDHPEARHHCWAYLLGDPEAASGAAMSDDGEPSGTAGKPILNVIQHKGIGDVVVVVTRYFGGIKLGAGGLVRAYANATEQALAALPLQIHVPHTTVTLVADFAHEQAVRHWCGQRDAAVDGVDYGNAVTLTLDVAATALDELHAFCAARGIEIA